MTQTVDPLTILPDGSFAIYVSPTSYIENKTLVADTAEAVTVPTGANYVVFGGTCNFGARYNAATSGTAAALADTTDGTGVAINPTIRMLRGVAEISLITHDTNGGTVSLEFYS